jgi:hypothetical protein
MAAAGLLDGVHGQDTDGATASRSRSTSEAVSVSVATLTSSFRVVPAGEDPAQSVVVRWVWQRASNGQMAHIAPSTRLASSGGSARVVTRRQLLLTSMQLGGCGQVGPASGRPWEREGCVR